MTEKEVQFECRVASHISEGFVHIFNKCLMVGYFMFAKKDVKNYFINASQAAFSLPLNCASKFMSFIRS